VGDAHADVVVVVAEGDIRQPVISPQLTTVLVVDWAEIVAAAVNAFDAMVRVVVQVLRVDVSQSSSSLGPS
jgi:hypothetical protein